MNTYIRTALLRGTVMLRRTIALFLICGGSSMSAEPNSSHVADSVAQVECHGKLRCGVVAVGGETTGTTLTFDGVTWELKFTDDKLKQFADSHHRKLATVTGTLSCVAGTERPQRWIVNVSSLKERDVKIKDDGVTITAHGVLEKAKPSGANSGLNLVTKDVTWSVQPSENPQLTSKLDSLLSKAVVMKGRVECAKLKDAPKSMKIIPDDVQPEPKADSNVKR